MRVALVLAALLIAFGGCGGDDDDETPADSELDAAVEEVLSDCLLPDETVSETVGEEIEFSTSSSGGLSEAVLGIDASSGEFAVTYSGCVYTAAAGGEYTISEHVDAEGNPDPGGFEIVASQESAEPVEGVGDEAVAYADELHFRIGERGYVVSGSDENFKPADPSTLEALAKETAATVPG